jgi:hypothetical protein
MTKSTEPEKLRVKLTNTIEARKARLPKKGDLEHRTLPVEEVELRTSGLTYRDETTGQDVKLLEFTGYASLFNRAYRVGRYSETITPGAFKRSLNNPDLDVVLRTEHSDLPLARTTGSVKLSDGSQEPTLQLSEDNDGLKVRALLDPTDPDVARLLPKYRRGDLKEMSFAFRSNDDEWSDDYTQRTIRSAELHRGDVSIVTFGAASNTLSMIRSEETTAELRKWGAEGMIGSLHEFAFQFVADHLKRHGRDATVELLEARAGKVISSQSMDVLRNVLDLVAQADAAVDEAQPLLADLMGVPNPDDDDDDDDDEDGDTITTSEQLDHLSADTDGFIYHYQTGGETIFERTVKFEGEEYWAADEDARKDFSDKERQNLADKKQAMPGGAFPIRNVADLKNAISAYGRAKDPAAAKAWIIKRAKALGATAMALLPEDWRADPEPKELVIPVARYTEFEAELRALGG